MRTVPTDFLAWIRAEPGAEFRSENDGFSSGIRLESVPRYNIRLNKYFEYGTKNVFYRAPPDPCACPGERVKTFFEHV